MNNAECICTLSQMKEGDVFELNGKTFTKWAGLIVAPDMEACALIKATAGDEFFNKYVVRILHASPHNESMQK